MKKTFRECFNYAAKCYEGEFETNSKFINEKSINDVIAKLMEDQSAQLVELCKADLVEIMRQMILSGDIARYTTIPEAVIENDTMVLNTKQKLVYIPYQEKLQLTSRIAMLELELRSFIGDEEFEDEY
jgi:hypothetical protein